MLVHKMFPFHFCLTILEEGHFLAIISGHIWNRVPSDSEDIDEDSYIISDDEPVTVSFPFFMASGYLF